MKNIQINTEFFSLEKVNKQFSRAKCRVMYLGDNPNNSSFEKENVEKALPTMRNIPVVGHFSRDKNDFKGHESKVEITDDGIEYYMDTIPYGVVSSDATFSWEEVEEKNGQIKSYLVVDGVYLWTGRYNEAYSVIEEGKSQSMEIQVEDYEMLESGYANITDFTFSALCILGDDVTPAFSSSRFVGYSLDKFKSEFSEMMKEIKTLYQVGGEEMNTCSKCGKEFEAETCGCEAIVEPVVEPIVEPVIEEPIIEEPVIDEPIVEEPVVEEPIIEEPVVDYQALYETLKVEFETLQSDFDSMKVELEGLETFKADALKEKHEAQVNELIANEEFSVLEEDDLSEIVENVHQFSLEEIESKLYSILGKKVAKSQTFSKKNKTQQTVQIQFNKQENKTSGKIYDSLFSEYKK